MNRPYLFKYYLYFDNGAAGIWFSNDPWLGNFTRTTYGCWDANTQTWKSW